MEMKDWWPLITAETREWLVEHNGESLPTGVMLDIERVTGPVATGTSWMGSDEAGRAFLSDDAVDWVETVANEEDAG